MYNVLIVVELTDDCLRSVEIIDGCWMEEPTKKQFVFVHM